MFALIVTRKGDIQEVVIASDQPKLQTQAARLDGKPLTWQQFFGQLGAHSNHDEEKSYEILPVQVLP